MAAVDIVTQYYHVYCENSYSPKYAHIWAPRHPGAVRELSAPERLRTWRADELRPE